jgi:hypothetical protein
VSARDGDAALGSWLAALWAAAGVRLLNHTCHQPDAGGGRPPTEGTRVLADLDALERAVSGRERYRVACRIQRHAGSGADTSAWCCVYLMSPT